MPKKTSKKKITKRAKKKIKDKNVNIVDSDSDDVLVNESERDVPTEIKSFAKARIVDEDDYNEVGRDEEDEERVDSEVEDEDKLGEDVEMDERDEDDDVRSEISDVSVEDKKKCLYKYAEDVSEDEFNEIEEEFFSDEHDDEDLPTRVPNDERITKPIMTKYERVRLLGIRTRQLALGAKPMIKDSDSLSSKEIAELELDHNIIPLIIIRPLPNGRKEYWKVDELSH